MTVRRESIELRTTDGWSLGADVFQGSARPRGVAVLAHALMARRSEFDRPSGAGLARFLVDRGWSVVAFDFRGHGESRRMSSDGASGPSWDARGVRYDDLVSIDLPAACDFARWQVSDRPIVVVGHSLGGHVALAAIGSGAVSVDALVGIGAAPWIPRLEPSAARWIAKRGALAVAAALARKLGRFPARSLRIGSDDEARGCMSDLDRFAATGRWTSADGSVDYWASLERVRVPVLQVVSRGDHFECAPECGRRCVARCAGPHDVVEVTGGDGGAPPPTHMGLVTGGRAQGTWQRIADWLSAVVSASEPSSATGGAR